MAAAAASGERQESLLGRKPAGQLPPPPPPGAPPAAPPPPGAPPAVPGIDGDGKQPGVAADGTADALGLEACGGGGPSGTTASAGVPSGAPGGTPSGASGAGAVWFSPDPGSGSSGGGRSPESRGRTAPTKRDVYDEVTEITRAKCKELFEQCPLMRDYWALILRFMRRREEWDRSRRHTDPHTGETAPVTTAEQGAAVSEAVRQVVEDMVGLPPAGASSEIDRDSERWDEDRRVADRMREEARRFRENGAALCESAEDAALIADAFERGATALDRAVQLEQTGYRG